MNKKDKKSKLRELIGREIIIAEDSDNFSGRVVFGFIDKDNYFSVCSPKKFNLQNDDGMRNPGYYVINANEQEGLAYRIKIRNVNNIESTNGTNTVVLGNNKEIK